MLFSLSVFHMGKTLVKQEISVDNYEFSTLSTPFSTGLIHKPTDLQKV